MKAMQKLFKVIMIIVLLGIFLPKTSNSYYDDMGDFGIDLDEFYNNTTYNFLSSYYFEANGVGNIYSNLYLDGLTEYHNYWNWIDDFKGHQLIGYSLGGGINNFKTYGLYQNHDYWKWFSLNYRLSDYSFWGMNSYGLDGANSIKISNFSNYSWYDEVSEYRMDSLSLEDRREIFVEILKEVVYLSARPKNGEVELRWASTDPNANADDFQIVIEVNGTLRNPPITPIVCDYKGEFKSVVTGLNNDEEYVFMVRQKEYKGIAVVKATPRDSIFFDTFNWVWTEAIAWGDGSPVGIEIGNYSEEYDLGAHGEVLVIEPEENISTEGPMYFVECVVNEFNNSKQFIDLRIKTEEGKPFLIYVMVNDSFCYPYELCFIFDHAEAIANTIGGDAFVFKGTNDPSGGTWADGNWHDTTLSLNEELLFYFDTSLEDIHSIRIGGYGKVYVDYFAVY